MPFVVDNSVVSGWYLASQANAYTDRVLELLRSETAIVPPLWECELANVARTRRDMKSSLRKRCPAVGFLHPRFADQR